eukprot:scaffold260885_cov67-Attheya_sp.AAC.2
MGANSPSTDVTKYDFSPEEEPSAINACQSRSIKEVAVDLDRRTQKRGVLISDVAEDGALHRNTPAYVSLFNTVHQSIAFKSPADEEAAESPYICSVGFLKVERNTVKNYEHLWIVHPHGPQPITLV